MRSFLRIFAVIYVPIVLILLWTFAYAYSLMVQSATEELKDEMQNMWVMLSKYDNSPDYQLARHRDFQSISDETSLRITLIRPDGVVVDDSYLDAPEILEMENHRTRPEVMSAIVRGEGFSQRFSDTIQMDMMYYARPLSNNMILRIAYPMKYVAKISTEWQAYVSALLLFLLLVIGLIAAFFARQISKPLKALDNVATSIENHESDIHFPEFANPSMSRISNTMYRVYTAMLENQKELREEQIRTGQILSTLEEAIILMDDEFQVIHCNRRVEDLLGIRFGPGDHILDRPTDAALLTFLRTIVQSDEQYFPRIEFNNQFFEIYIRRVEANLLMVLHDITDRGRYDVYKSELVGNITHELKTPMASIQGYAETLLSTPDIQEEDRTRFLQIIMNHTRRLNNLIADILELHQLEAIGTEIQLDEPTIGAELLHELKARYQDAEKTVDLDIPETELGIRHEHLSSILTNLVDNALRYSTGSGVQAAVERHENQLIVSVSDQGPRIPDTDRKRVFERFYTISKSRNRNNGGTGLGLSIVKHIARAYGGSVTLTANDMGGNTFRITLLEQTISD